MQMVGLGRSFEVLIRVSTGARWKSKLCGTSVGQRDMEPRIQYKFWEAEASTTHDHALQHSQGSKEDYSGKQRNT